MALVFRSTARTHFTVLLSASLAMVRCAAPVARVSHPPLAAPPLEEGSRVVRAFFEAYGSRSQDEVRRFVETYQSRGRSEAERARTIAQYPSMFAELGPLTLRDLAADPDGITALARSEREGWLSIRFLFEAGPPHALVGERIAFAAPPDGAERAPRTDEEIAVAVDAYLRRRVADERFAGVVVVTHGGRAIVQSAWGWADREAKAPNALDTTFSLASVSKTFTAVAVMQLAEAHKLQRRGCGRGGARVRSGRARWCGAQPREIAATRLRHWACCLSNVPSPAVVYARRRPEETTLYKVVQDNLSTLYGAVADHALAIRLPGFVRRELEGYLDCGLLCRGFARVQCGACSDKRLVAFGCGGRGFCPSCLGRKMAQTTLNLSECVLPSEPLRQWVLTFPFAWRSRLGFDAALFSALTRLFVQTVLRFYTRRMKKAGVARGQSGAVVALQRTSSDLRINPHLHVLFLDGIYREEGDAVVFHALPHLSTREVGAVLESAVRRIARYLARRGLVRGPGDSDVPDNDNDDNGGEPTTAQGHAALCASAASGQSPPAGPELRRKEMKLVPLAGNPLHFDKPLCASLDGFTLHAATRAGGRDARAREALLKYVLRPPIAQERVTTGPDGLVRIVLKHPFADGTVAIDLDPLSLLSRLAASVPAPGRHTVRYAGVLASASKLRPRIVPKPPAVEDSGEADAGEATKSKRAGCRYRSWAELLRTLGIDAFACPNCQGRMRILALVRDPDEVRRFLQALGESTAPPKRAPARGPPYWASRALRIRSGADAA